MNIFTEIYIYFYTFFNSLSFNSKSKHTENDYDEYDFILLNDNKIII